ncbi:MAG TPA: cobyrinate a,c-diamide synthase [Solirubrobacterales bacterium]|nr:cobyrinate a,c-diamide synthase [Solirubrobacterales bacterium]
MTTIDEPTHQAGCPGFLISATHSGAGKTTVTTLLLRALRQRGLEVQAFKIGPDFIDTAHHSAICGRPSINLDLWMMGEDGIRRSHRRRIEGAEFFVIEAMGGLYDGADGGEEGSAAHVAKLLGVPVIAILDAWGMTRTAAAMLQGLIDFDPELEIAGCVFNRVGSERHAQMIDEALPAELRRKVVGYVPRRSELEIAERHLGLTTVQELEGGPERERAQAQLAAALDVDRLLEIGRRAQKDVPQVFDPATAPADAPVDGLRLGIAHDRGFHFYYEENLRLLREAGFELIDVSPISDDRLEDVDALYVGGGYPESFAAELAANDTFAADLRGRVAAGMPVYAECGGYIYLGRSLTGFDGERHRMSGVLPIDFEMNRDHLAIAYVDLSTHTESPLGPAGTQLRGQEFHQSRIVRTDLEPNLYEVTTSDGRTYREGHVQGSVTGSYSHVHLPSNPTVVENFLRAARAHRAARLKRDNEIGENLEPPI